VKGERGELIVGLMSGTSADGIDAVVARIEGRAPRLRAKVLAHVHNGFRPEFQRRVLRAALHGTVTDICELNFILGEHLARAALAAIRKAGLAPGQIAAIASHGQTMNHLPGGQVPSTLQIGEPAVIAERTGIKTIADFRVRDVAAGGQGAPLVPFADWVLLSDEARPRMIQNLGGIANLTFLPPRARREEVVAFDTGPGNMVIDALVSALSHGKQAFDLNGRLAGRGKVSPALLSEMMTHPFIRRAPPKSTGREEFGEAFSQQTLRHAHRLRLRHADIVATATAFTAETIAAAYKRFIFPKLTPRMSTRLQIILGGGGAKNLTLRQMLDQRIGAGAMHTHEEFGIGSSAKEGLAFAVLGYETLHGRPSNLPNVPGARHAVVLGKVVCGMG